jgi:riboflavin transporter
MKSQQKSIRILVLLALFTAMCIVGAYIKIPNPITSSIAFDSLPAYLAALVLGGIPGAAVAFLGHMVSAALGGFPMSLPIHLFIATQMAVIMIIFSFIAKKINLTAAIIAGILLNGIAAPAALILIPGMGLPVFLGALVPLTAASIFNVSLAGLVYQSIKNVKEVKELTEASNGI